MLWLWLTTISSNIVKFGIYVFRQRRVVICRIIRIRRLDVLQQKRRIDEGALPNVHLFDHTFQSLRFRPLRIAFICRIKYWILRKSWKPMKCRKSTKLMDLNPKCQEMCEVVVETSQVYKWTKMRFLQILVENKLCNQCDSMLMLPSN